MFGLFESGRFTQGFLYSVLSTVAPTVVGSNAGIVLLFVHCFMREF